MAGLPGTGKSTLSARLADRLGGVVLCKDIIRAEMFNPVNFTREQDDAAVEAIYSRAHRILCTTGCPVIVDGRTFSQAYQVRDLFAAADRIGVEPRIIECICSDNLVRERLQRDFGSASHLAANRTFELYLEVKARAEPLTVLRLVLDTGTLELDECLKRAMEFLAMPE
jgi:predicted kinase